MGALFVPMIDMWHVSQDWQVKHQIKKQNSITIVNTTLSIFTFKHSKVY